MFGYSTISIQVPSPQSEERRTTIADLVKAIEDLVPPTPSPKKQRSTFSDLRAEVIKPLQQAKTQRDAFLTLHENGYEIELGIIEALDFEISILTRTLELLDTLNERTT